MAYEPSSKRSKTEAKQMQKLRVDQKRLTMQLYDEGYGTETLVCASSRIYIEIEDLQLVLKRRVQFDHGTTSVDFRFKENQAREIKKFLNDYYPD